MKKIEHRIHRHPSLESAHNLDLDHCIVDVAAFNRCFMLDDREHIRMNPWHSTDPDRPCPAGCGEGHQPKEIGDYWGLYHGWSVEEAEIFTYDPSSQYSHRGWLTNGVVDFWRIPDGHPPIPEE